MRRIGYGVFLLSLVSGLYFGLTWFFFGSPHPCGILEARRKPEVRKTVEWTRKETWETYKMLTGWDKETVEARTELLKGLEGDLERALKALHLRVWQHTPAECAWQAITWKPPQK